MFSIRSNILGAVGIFLQFIRFAWILFRLIRGLDNRPGGWESGSMWVGGPMGWQGRILQLIWFASVTLLALALISVLDDVFTSLRNK